MGEYSVSQYLHIVGYMESSRFIDEHLYFPVRNEELARVFPIQTQFYYLGVDMDKNIPIYLYYFSN